MARGNNQRLSASARSEFGEEKTTPKNVAKLTSKFDVNMIQPTADGSYGINYDTIIGAVENFGADAKSAGLITDVLEHSYLKSVKAITELEAEKNGETSPALTRTLNDRYNPKIKELESSIADELKSVSSGTLRVIEGMLSKMASDIDSQKSSGQGGRIVGAYKQGEVRKLFNDIYDTLNS
jgi:hypothetical protein